MKPAEAPTADATPEDAPSGDEAAAEEHQPSACEAESLLLSILTAAADSIDPSAAAVAAETSPARTPSPPSGPVHGVVVGKLAAVSEGLLVTLEWAPEGVSARAMCCVSPSDVGRDVAVLFEQGDQQKPMIVGLMEPSRPAVAPAVTSDGERVVIAAEREIVLKCGDASITLTRAGKIILKGAYVSSVSSGVNRIRGATVEIN